MIKCTAFTAIVLVTIAGAAAAAAQSAGLSIVVIEGEGAVNIIQQKTAVRALVEVRDRNNLPVSGASVTFKIGGQGGAALSGGSPTITITTNSAGRAALSSGLTPTAPGTVQISVSATYQGLAATAAIAQTVVATVAQAAAIGGAAAAGAAVGGGLGTGAMIGIVAGGVAAAGGAVVGGGLLSGGNENEKDILCVITVTPTVVTVPPAGGTVVITVVASPQCDSGRVRGNWDVFGAPTFVTVNPTSGIGNGTVTVTIPPFTQPTANPPRTFAIAIQGTTVNFSQAGGATAARACVPELRQGVSGEARRTELGASTGTFLFNYVTGQARMMVSYEGRALFDTGCTGAETGMRSLSYAGRDTAVTVQVIPNCMGGPGTSWEYRLTCSR